MTTETFYSVVRATHDVQAAVFRAFAAAAEGRKPLLVGEVRRAADQAEALLDTLRALLIAEGRRAVEAQTGAPPWEDGDGTAAAVETGDAEE